MIKILGCILILSASVCACVFYENTEKAKINATKEMIEFIRYIRSQIEYFLTPLNKIYSSYEHKSPITERLSKEGPEFTKDFLEKGDFAAINELFGELGKGPKSEQLSLCSYTAEVLERSYEKKKTELPNKIKAFRAIALFCGFCAVILLI